MSLALIGSDILPRREVQQTEPQEKAQISGKNEKPEKGPDSAFKEIFNSLLSRKIPPRENTAPKNIETQESTLKASELSESVKLSGTAQRGASGVHIGKIRADRSAEPDAAKVRETREKTAGETRLDDQRRKAKLGDPETLRTDTGILEVKHLGIKNKEIISTGEGSDGGIPVPETRQAKAAKKDGVKPLARIESAEAGVFAARQSASETRAEGKNARADKTDSNDKEAVSARGSGKKKTDPGDRFTISLSDLRKSDEGGDSVKSAPGKDSNSDRSAENSHEIRIRLTDNPAPGAKKAASAERAESSFQKVLAQQLKETYNAEIAKSAAIVLRDNGSGLIRLTLHPESLGSVKVRLELSENSIIGKIMVDSEAAKTAFEQNLPNLAQAFTDSGFDSARLEVSVGSGNGRNGAEGQGDSSPYFTDRLREFGNSVPDADRVFARSATLDILV